MLRMEKMENSIYETARQGLPIRPASTHKIRNVKQVLSQALVLLIGLSLLSESKLKERVELT